MRRLARIPRPDADAGAVHTLLALWGFVDDTTFLTKAGHVGVVYRVRGIDPEGHTHADRDALIRPIAAALQHLDVRCRLSQYLIKRVADPIEPPACAHPVARAAIHQRLADLNRRPDRYALDLYLVLVYEAPTRARTSTSLEGLWRAPRQALRAWLSTRQTCTLLAAALDDAVRTLHQQAEALEVQLRAFGLTRLAKAEAFQFFRALVNDPETAAGARLLADTHLDVFVADAPIECHRDHLRVGTRAVRVLTLKAPPRQTCAALLADLTAIPGEWIACLEWQRIPTDRMRRDLQARRRHFFHGRVSLVSTLSAETRPEDQLVNDSATALVRQLGDALTALEVDGHVFGACSLTLVLHGHDTRALAGQAAEARALLATHDGQFVDETAHLLHAWLAVVPGNGAFNLRRLTLLDTTVADLSLLWTHDPGTAACPYLGQPALAVFDTPSHVPFAYALHVQDVGHTLVLGATGSGKSFLLNLLVTHAQAYDPVTVIFDLGHSFRTIAAALDGRTLEIGLDTRDVSINPFAFPPTPGHLHFLHAFVRVLLEGADGARLTDREDREVYDAVTQVYVLDPPQRRLGTVAHLLPRALGMRLHPWVADGRYAGLFDNEVDTVSLARLQVIECEAMRDYPVPLEPLLFYLLHRVTARVHDPALAGTLKLCVLDEAWRFLQHPILRAYAREALKTWRKHRGALLLATQAIEDFASVDLLRTVIESCPTKLLLANPGADRATAADLFQLNARALDLLAGLRPRQDVLLTRPDLTKVLTLTVPPEHAWLYATTPVDPDRLAAFRRTAERSTSESSRPADR